METDLGILGVEIQAHGFEEVMDSLEKLLRKSQRLQKEFSSYQLPSSASSKKNNGTNLPTDVAISALKDFSGFGEAVANDLTTLFGSVFDEFVFGGKQATTIVKSLEKDLLGLGNQYFTGKKSAGSGDLLSSLIGVAGNFITDLFPGFASGGQFKVGGVAGRDRNLVGLRLSRGEQVSIETPAQQKAATAANSQQTININFQINTPDAGSFRRSQSQIQSDALLSAQRILKRNG